MSMNYGVPFHSLEPTYGHYLHAHVHAANDQQRVGNLHTCTVRMVSTDIRQIGSMYSLNRQFSNRFHGRALNHNT